ncbi:MAG: AraC family transcriptional regulator [Blautia sp.]|nr:AraC family transcriptional regulator [Blautia sp.]
MKKDIPTMNDGSEIVRYNNIRIPYYVSEGKISWFENRRAICHWHNDFEIMRINSGHMHYYIDGKDIFLNPDDILLINSKHMHYGYEYGNEECDFICYLIDPMLLACNNTALYEKLILPIVDSGIPHWVLDCNYAAHQSALDMLDRIYSLNRAVPDNQVNHQQPDCSEYRSVQLFHNFIYDFYTSTSFVNENSGNSNNQALLRKMILYIYQNYKNDIQIDEIAGSVNISRTTCCKLFRTINSTPIGFLNHYRLELAHNLILHSDRNITSVALEVGFNDPGYFARRFKLKYGMSPKELAKSRS